MAANPITMRGATVFASPRAISTAASTNATIIAWPAEPARPTELLGLDRLQRDLWAFADFARSLDAKVAAIVLKPHDRASLDAGVREIERAINDRAGRFIVNADVRSIAKDLKETRITTLRRRFRKLTKASMRGAQAGADENRRQASAITRDMRGFPTASARDLGHAGANMSPGP